MNLQLFDQYFQMYDDKFEYSKVSRIRWVPEERISTFMFIPVGKVGMYQLTIEFGDEPPVELGMGGVPTGWANFHGLGMQEFGALRESMKRLLAATLDVRLARYRGELERNGNFEYDDVLFFSDGSAQRRGRRYALDLNTPPKAIATHTEIKCLPRGSITVKTDWDRDCFHALLNDMHRASAAR